MKDLLGDEIAKPTIKVFRINQCCWFAGESLEACAEEAALNYDEGLDESEAYELTEKELHTLKFDPCDDSEITTFAVALERLVSSNTAFPVLFAHTEY